MWYIGRHMGIQVFSVLVEFKRNLLDMHFTYIKCSVQIWTMYENIHTCQLCAVSKDELPACGILNFIILSQGAFPKKVAGRKSGAFQWNYPQGGEDCFPCLKLSLLTELTSLYHWTLTRWLFLKTKIWCIIHFSLKLKVKCEYSFFFFFLALPWKKINVAGAANKVLSIIIIIINEWCLNGTTINRQQFFLSYTDILLKGKKWQFF